MRDRPPEHPFGQEDEPPSEDLIHAAEERAETEVQRAALQRAKERFDGGK